jgi:hypothetical protein
MWRIDERPGFVAAIMRYRGWKPFQCRACGDIRYRPAIKKATRQIGDSLTFTRAR